MRAPYWILLMPLFACAPSRAVQVDDGTPKITVLSPTPGEAMEVTGPSQFLPGRYTIPPVEGQEELGILRLTDVRDLTLDLRQVQFDAAEDLQPGQASGVGIFLANCENITVLGGLWRGYANPIRVEGSRGIRILEANLDGFYSPVLESTVTRDSKLDWLEPELLMGAAANPWRGGIEVWESADVVVQRCRARHGAVGLRLSGSKDCLVAGNDFSFLSAYGTVVANSLDCTVGFNNLEYNVRGYSHGTYSSGQNSAAVLVVGASQRNRIAYNRMTHSGSGVLLYGTQELTPSENRIFGNDCQFSVFAGIDSRQTRATVVENNQLSGALHFGVHSHADQDMVLLDNEIGKVSGPGIGLFSSARASIYQNRLVHNQVGIEIAWGTSSELSQEPPLAGASRDHFVLGNRFDGNGQDLVGRDSQALAFAGNQFLGERQRLHVERIEAWMDPGEDPQTAPEQDTVVGWLAGSNGVMPTGNLAGVSLRLWDGNMPKALELAQSKDAPRIPGYAEGAGRVLSEYQGGVETIEVGLLGPWDFPSGESKTRRRQPGGLFAKARWQALWFPFDPETQDPRGDLELWRKLSENPVLRRTVDHFLEPRPGDEIKKRVSPVRFGLMAETEVEVPQAGSYRLSVMSDDGIRIWIGGEIAFEDWTWHATRQKDVLLTLPLGPLPVRFEYFQLDGAAELVLELHRAR